MMNGIGSMGPLMGVFMVIFWIFIILGLVFAARWLLAQGKAKKDGTGSQSALEVLKMRFARGEISREEFERMKKDLK